MIQGENTLHSETLIIKKNISDEIDLLIATGNPANFNTIENQEATNAKANTIKYYPKKDTIELISNAIISNRDDLIKGDKLNYNLKTKNLNSKESKQRTTVIISPKTSNLKK